MNVFSERIENLRTLMRGRGWDAIILTGSDPHGSEYPAGRFKQVEWTCGFTGEAGDLVITLDHAGLWTDSRYFIQARRQLDGTGVALHKTRVPEQVLIPQWLSRQFGPDAIIAVDGLCQNAFEGIRLSENFQVVSIPDLLDSIWKDRPGIPQTPVTRIDPGETRAEKISWLRSVLAREGCSSMLVTALDEIAWLLNIRASDIEYNPLCISYLLVGESDVKWFAIKDEVQDEDTRESFETLRSEGIEILPYNEVFLHLDDDEGRLFVDSSSANYHLYSLLNRDILFEKSPVALKKAVKNPVETEGVRKAHIEDGAAMEKFLFWLEKSISEGKEISERDAAVKLSQYRSESEGFVGESFETISAYGENAALPHYSTPVQNAPLIKGSGLYLCDSGGQYEYGTTDITRTIPMGDCSEAEKEDYTLVLKGHIRLAMAIFPEGTAGCQLDVLARNPLWLSLKNFGHGTGHGVGYFLGVHEGPQDIRQNFNSQPLLSGMITSDEPGIYREGLYGIRHENLLLCKEKGVNEFGKWMEFETLTMCHFDTSAVVADLLDDDERHWLNEYNDLVYRTLSGLLPEEVAEWLKDKTSPI